MKCNFPTISFTDEFKSKFDEPDGWARDWVRNGNNQQT